MQWFLAAAVCRLCVVCTADKPAAHLLLMSDQGGVRMYLYFKACFRTCGAALLCICLMLCLTEHGDICTFAVVLMCDNHCIYDNVC